jgi:uncharacterized DUF497 family protein
VRDDYFEWDDEKSKLNKAKHGIDFEEARDLWKAGVHEFPSSRDPEMRYLVIGKIGMKFWTAVISYRGTRRRIISVRTATQKEKDLYETQEGKKSI